MIRLLPAAVLAAALLSCERRPVPPPPPQVTGRCDVDLAATGLFSQVGTGATAKLVAGPADLIGGQFAQGTTGDALLQNDRIRVVIDQPGRNIGPLVYGGNLIDADLRRPAGEPGRDQFGHAGLLYQFGRTAKVDKLEVLLDGSAGGYAVVAATGADALNNYVHLAGQLAGYTGGVAQLSVNPDLPLPLLITTYYVLSPGESRIRVLTAFCNTGHSPVVTEVGELIDKGGSMDYFNPAGCSHLMGNRGCLADPGPWFGWQGDGVAYGIREYQLDRPAAPDAAALVSVAGITATLAGGHDSQGILAWLDSAATHPGALGIRPGETRSFLRDFVVAADLAGVSSYLMTLDNTGHARVNGTVTQPDGITPAVAAKVAIADSAGNLQTLAVSDAAGKFKVDLVPGTYQLTAGVPGHALPTPLTLTVPSSGSVAAALTVGPSRTLTVTLRDPAGQAMPGKVTVICPTGTCPQPLDSYRLFSDVEQGPSNVAAIALIAPGGTVQVALPPGQYEAVVTRGPEYNAYPDTWPAHGALLDLRAADAVLGATLAKVVDSTGWLSADLHVHGVGSPDSAISNAERVLTFAAEGVDILCSTDHDFVTDFAPVVRSLEATPFLATMMGEEVSSFDFGHFNAYPMTRTSAVNGGAFDWAGAPNNRTWRLGELFSGLHQLATRPVVQLNHPRGSTGALTRLQVDTATGASHADPVAYRMTPAPDATANDSKLFSDDFDAIEVQNGTSASYGVLNDWMTLLSRGAVKTATAVSDTHYATTYPAGHSRTFVNLGISDIAGFDPQALAAAIKAHRAFGTNGPFIRLNAYKVDAQGLTTGSPAGIGDTLSINPGAGEAVLLNVDVQAPEWIDFDTVEIYTHAFGREAVNGVSNDTWPASRILQSQTFPVQTLPIEAVPGPNGQTFRRLHLNANFTVHPTADTWYVVVVRGSDATHTLFPLVFRGATCSGAICTANTAHAFAFSNAILIDGDGSGAYDHFPLVVPHSLPVKGQPKPSGGALTPELIRAMFKGLASDGCGD